MTTHLPSPRRHRRLLIGLVAPLVLALTACLPSWQAADAVTVAASSPTTLDLSWPQPVVDADATVDSFEVSLDGAVRATLPGTQTTVHIVDLAPATTYRVTIRARDSKGQWSSPGLEGQATTAAATAAITERRTITWGGLTRTYRLDIPAGYTGAQGARLLVGLHGGLSSGDGFATYTRWPAAGAAHGYLVAYPDGVAGPQGFRTWNGGGCCGYAQASNIDDVGFVTALIGELRGRFSVPKVALTGHSNGAILAYRIACDRADAIDGVGIWAGTMFVSPCALSRPVSLLHLHGLADTNLPFAGGTGSGVSGATFPPAMNGIERVRQADGCGTAPATDTVNGVATSTWSCPVGVSLRLITVDDANHEWAGGINTALAGTPSTKLDATAAIASFVDGL